MTLTDVIKVGLIGAGGIGSAHSSAYEQIADAKITAVMDVRGEQAERIAAVHGAKAYTSLDEMLTHETLDMVDICTPSYTHAELSIRCANSGLHVLVEKPIAHTLEEAQAMVAAARQNHVLFMVAQVIRFWPEYAYLKQVCDAGTYGRLVQAWFSRVCGAPSWEWDQWYTDPKRSGLAPFELHVHDLDFIHHLLGKPAAVRSLGITQNDIRASFIKTQYLYDTLPGAIVEAEGGWWRGRLARGGVVGPGGAAGLWRLARWGWAAGRPQWLAPAGDCAQHALAGRPLRSLRSLAAAEAQVVSQRPKMRPNRTAGAQYRKNRRSPCCVRRVKAIQ